MFSNYLEAVILHFSVFYKKFKEDWILCDFIEPSITKITNKILNNTKNTIVFSYGNLLCKNKQDLEIIHEILMQESLEFIKQKESEYKKMPNLLIEPIKQLIKSKNID